MKKEDVIKELSKYAKPKVEKLAIGYPWSSPFIWTRFTETALNMQRPENSRWIRGNGWCPARRHTDICEKALEWGASHILILGSDQTYKEDMIPRLIKRVEEDGCEAIAAMVPARGYVKRMNMKPFQPMAWRFKQITANDFLNKRPRKYRGYELDGDMMDVINPDDGELQKIDSIGSGVLMFATDTLLAMERPWFDERYVPEDYRREASMDTRFVWNLKAQGNAQVWVDTTIDVGHIHAFEIDRSYQERFTDWTNLEYGECRPKERCTSQF